MFVEVFGVFGAVLDRGFRSTPACPLELEIEKFQTRVSDLLQTVRQNQKQKFKIGVLDLLQSVRQNQKQRSIRPGFQIYSSRSTRTKNESFKPGFQIYSSLSASSRNRVVLNRDYRSNSTPVCPLELGLEKFQTGVSDLLQSVYQNQKQRNLKHGYRFQVHLNRITIPTLLSLVSQI